jgi:hypothetical protein
MHDDENHKNMQVVVIKRGKLFLQAGIKDYEIFSNNSVSVSGYEL